MGRRAPVIRCWMDNTFRTQQNRSTATRLHSVQLPQPLYIRRINNIIGGACAQLTELYKLCDSVNWARAFSNIIVPQHGQGRPGNSEPRTTISITTKRINRQRV